MSVKAEKESVNVVELDSSDEEEDGNRAAKRRKESIERPLVESGTALVSSSSDQNQTLEWRSFWKAGAYNVGPKKQGSVQDLEHARVHPKFLHSNATSHKWAFGAIAELLDNAVDEICHGATFVKVDKIYNLRDNTPALLFLDDGGGMDPECVRQCMSLGYSEKKANTTIGQYGNGFKTSTMRLGADVIVFSCSTRGSHATQSIGLLSYTYLRKTGQDDVVVPMVDFELAENQRKPIIYTSEVDWSNNLNIIVEWSPFATKEELLSQFDDIGSHGTKVIIYNLWFNDDGLLELDFDNDEEDIRLRDEVTRGKLSKKDRLVESHISYRIRYSLRAYVSILYLRKFTNFQIILRGIPVQQYIIADELRFSKVIMYKPQLGSASKEVSVETTIGFVKEAPLLGVSGLNVYHKNRLIRPFWKVTNDGSSRGNGVVGVLEANFIEPAHDKQDFERSALFLRLETRLKFMIMDFWKSHFHLLGLQSTSPDVRNLQKGCPTDQHYAGLATTSQKELAIGHHVIGLSANVQNENHLDQHVVGAAANLQQGMSRPQPIVGLAANFQDVPKGQHVIGLAAGKEGSSVDSMSSELVDKICEENIQLFMRCEGHRQKEIELKQTVEKLEADLEEMKKKCSQLVSHIEIQKKQKTIKQLTEKA